MILDKVMKFHSIKEPGQGQLPQEILFFSLQIVLALWWIYPFSAYFFIIIFQTIRVMNFMLSSLWQIEKAGIICLIYLFGGKKEGRSYPKASRRNWLQHWDPSLCVEDVGLVCEWCVIKAAFFPFLFFHRRKGIRASLVSQHFIWDRITES